ncbi:MAG: DoxX family protein [Bacteroidales bacterium]|nr:DoxX family protein [Bacteroidales bacterium]
MRLFSRNELFKIESAVIDWMKKNGYFLLRVSLGIVFFWFGILKFFPGVSPAQELAIETISIMTFGLIPDGFIINGLALWEVLIGIGLITGKFMRETLILLFLQMAGTFMPVFLFPDEIFVRFPYALSLEGQYIIKNIIIISAGIVLGGQLTSGHKKPDSNK